MQYVNRCMHVPNIWDILVSSVTACRSIKDSVYVYLPSRLPGSRALVLLKRPESETAYHSVSNDVANYERSYTSTRQCAFVT